MLKCTKLHLAIRCYPCTTFCHTRFCHTRACKYIYLLRIQMTLSRHFQASNRLNLLHARTSSLLPNHVSTALVYSHPHMEIPSHIHAFSPLNRTRFFNQNLHRRKSKTIMARQQFKLLMKLRQAESHVQKTWSHFLVLCQRHNSSQVFISNAFGVKDSQRLQTVLQIGSSCAAVKRRGDH